MKKCFILILALLCTCAISFSSAIAADDLMFVNANPNVNFRSEASTDSTILWRIPYGCPVLKHSTSNGWSRVTFERKTGYIQSQFLSAINPDPGCGRPQTSQQAFSSHTISQGMESYTVMNVQLALKSLGYPVGEADGVFGSKTFAQVKKFQENNELDVDGIVGNATKNALWNCTKNYLKTNGVMTLTLLNYD